MPSCCGKHCCASSRRRIRNSPQDRLDRRNLMMVLFAFTDPALAAFWKDRAKTYAGAQRQLAQALESIGLCTRLRSAAGRAGAKGSL